ncbi:MAG: NFACT family protein [Clostridia bacterium]|nr:NFACT family protein [Clostridia bacterium]
MALDGLFLSQLVGELSAQLLNTRVEKIYQPSKEELVFVMRTRQGVKKLYLNCRADSARVHLTEQSFINPANPPMLCMLLRKKFTSAWLDAIEQAGFERIVRFRFTALNDFGERVALSIVCEIMGRYSNIIFLDENDVIIDSVKRVGHSKSGVREILPGMDYVMPPAQDKCNLLNTEAEVIIDKIRENKNALLSKSILKTMQGISPLRCMEVALEAYGEEKAVYEIAENTAPLAQALEHLKELLNKTPAPCMVSDENKAIAFSFCDILQYGDLCRKQYFSSLSELLDTYYENRLNTIKRNASGGELLKLIVGNIDKISRKLSLQKKELAESEDNEKYKLYGELINANLHTLENNVSRYEILNYYTGETLEIEADIRLTPAQNAARYYKEYRKRQNAQTFIREQIEIGEQQLEYLESVLDILERAETPEEIAALKTELAAQGYLKKKTSKREKAPKELLPLLFQTSGGFSVKVGRNNLSNDKLTFKTAGGNDIWFHTKEVHGSHTVLFTNGRDVPQEDLVEAAGIGAYYSKARESSNVAVDYCRIKFVKRQPGGIPGRVFYIDYKTLYVNPDKEMVEKLKK